MEVQMHRRILVLFVFLMMINNVMALGVTPGRNTFEYEPGKIEEASFSVVNSGNEDINIAVFADGEMADNVALSDVSFFMDKDEERKSLSYSFKIPSGLEPGRHETNVVVMQLGGKSSGGDTFIGAAVGVSTQIVLNVPYPGKFVESELSVFEKDGKIQFIMPAVSRGDLDIARVGAEVVIYSSLNEKIESLNSEEFSLRSGERKDLIVDWNPNVEPGPYRAVATVVYDEQTLTLEKEFDVGARRLSLEGVEVNDFSLGEIAKFEMLVQNHWSEVIEDVVAEMQIFNKKGEVMAEFKSANYDLNPREKTLMVAFWDSEGVSENTYDSTLFLNYGESSERKNLELEVSRNEVKIIGAGFIISPVEALTDGSGGLNIKILIGVIVFLVILNISWFVFLRKRVWGKLKESGKKK
jgi:hypothetical protein